MKKRYQFCSLIAIILMLSLASCKKWLNVKAPLQVDQNTVYSTQQGFREVLNGVYLQMGSQSLYGRDLTFGLMSVLGRSYDTTISAAIGNLYYEGAKYNFDDPDVKAVFTNIWDSMYLCIANLNNLLENANQRKSIFTGDNYNTIKGEAMGLRAFIHFDLLRMFSPSPAAAGLHAPGIPYVTKLSPIAVQASTTGAVIDSCISDLLVAKSLLSDADLTTSKFTSWAVNGLLARIYLYKGDLANAQMQALSVINSNRFPLSVNNKDLMFTNEHLFSLFSYSEISLQYYKTVFNTTPPLGLSARDQIALFVTGGGATSDWRRAFVDPSTGVALGNTISPRKFYGATANVLPMIRMTEMYYIAAECATATQDTLSATALLDTVRVHRNIAKYALSALSADSLNTEIRKEYQKEFLGEGQMFFYYKRKNMPFSSLPFTKVPVVANASYVFTKPD
ncbi:RagB/SusD family nutrient uptake outer membrane protein [Arachidicoccus sp.]|uniref:RagB/SusD family nutrient uptake outer membrane protein n=1 Tax=Arachidicoccus sp. TaxID=1872624 RepID=UPI003D200226